MFGMKFYDNNVKDNNVKKNKELEETVSSDNNSIYVVKNAISEEFELKNEYFDKWKNLSNNDNGEYKSNEIIMEENYAAESPTAEEEEEVDYYGDVSVYSEYDLENTVDKINENDDDEDIEDKLYVISLDGSPHFYEADLVSARTTMWKIANNLLKSKKDSSSFYVENNKYIFTNNLNKVSLISPYNFFGLNYHYTICELQIDYVIRYNL